MTRRPRLLQETGLRYPRLLFGDDWTPQRNCLIQAPLPSGATEAARGEKGGAF